MQLETAKGRRLGKTQLAQVLQMGMDNRVAQMISAYTHPGNIAEIRMNAPRALAWSAESPSRYRVVIELLNSEGQVAEAVTCWTGFRRVEVRDRRLLLNGVPMFEYLCNTAEISRRRVDFIGLPLKLPDCDGAPARVVAIEHDGG